MFGLWNLNVVDIWAGTETSANMGQETTIARLVLEDMLLRIVV